ncbi:hypothetical protein L1987_59288 [Smallanthus sonchifolius]|uniref:Uncharacterized protein n=1 Tax=Smallanthus sonchifolius TaxID=185202 RepID=A0ACB9D4V4_9ASTR|nr:hypothetical protein L1987_59288 [Smallanthus sonchifolius]
MCKEIYASSPTSEKRKSSEVDRSQWFKKHQTDLRVLLSMNMFNPGSFPRGYEFESFLLNQARENFKSINQPVKKKRATYTEGSKQVIRLIDPLLPTGSYRERRVPQIPTTVLPQYIEVLEQNTGSLQPFTRMYYDSKDGELVVKEILKNLS